LAPKGNWLNYWNTAVSSGVVAPGVGLLWGELNKEISPPLQTALNLTEISTLKNSVAVASGATTTYHEPQWAGVDCVAMAKNAVWYPGSPYLWAQSQIRNYPDSVNGVVAVTNHAEMSANIRKYPNLKYAVPGDVMCYNNHAHIGFVLNNDGSGDVEGIKLIESTHRISPFDIANVSNLRTLGDIQTDGKPWVVARLK
jgi:hypothetical protein